MPSPTELALATYETFANQFIAPRSVRRRWALQVGAFQTIEPVAHDIAVRAKYKPVKTGWRWGPKWSTCWFKLAQGPGVRPKAERGGELALRFSTDTEGLVYIDGVPHQGLDVNRDLVKLPRGLVQRAVQGKLELYIEAACNHPFGVFGLPWESDDTKRRWESATPGHLLAAEIVEHDATVRELYETFLFALGLARELTPPSPPMHAPAAPWVPGQAAWQSSRAEQLLLALRRVVDLLSGRDDEGVRSAAAGGLRLLRAALVATPAESSLNCHAVGHAHIDTAWLWPLRETRRKCLRTFSNVLRLMDEDNDFAFLCTQAQQYAFIEADSPKLFAQIRRRVSEGRWEPGGGMWVEPDCNVPSGESLCRQLLHGGRYWASRFGDKARQRHLFLPDTFGFPAQLPQLMALAGLDTFITNKMSWNDTHPFPHTTFSWAGLDGTRVLGHQTPGNDYNATLSAREMKRAEANHRTKQLLATPESVKTGESAFGARYLQPFGFGDGGGGPTAQMLLHARLAARCDGVPVTRLSRADAFCAALHQDAVAHERSGEQLPLHRGELYLELHRGTLTTQAWLKHANRQAEDDLRLAEALLAGSPTALTRAERTKAMAELDEAWKLLLLNQFHDILPGSSIAWVYDDAREQHARISETSRRWIDRGVDLWAAAMDTRDTASPVICFNPSSSVRGGVFGEGAAAFVAGAGELGCEVVDVEAPNDVTPVQVTINDRAKTATLRNGVVEVVVDRLGRVTSFRAVAEDLPDVERRELAAGPLGELVLFEDHPRMWEAWDIDAATLRHPVVQTTDATSWKVIETGAARATIQVTRPIGERSVIEQTISLSTESATVEVRCRVTWKEERRLLRALFPTTVRSGQALYQTQFGHVARSTSPGTAAFETPVQRWCALTDAHGGLGVLNDHKYGAACEGSTLALTLLRAPSYPDPHADRGEHEFTYGITHVPSYEGAAHLEVEAEAIHRPVLLRSAAREQEGLGMTAWQPVTIDFDPPGHVAISALKFAEENDGSVVLRLAETAGAATPVRVTWNLDVGKLEAVDLLEMKLASKSPHSPEGLRHRKGEGTTVMTLKAFQVVSLRVWPASTN